MLCKEKNISESEIHSLFPEFPVFNHIPNNLPNVQYALLLSYSVFLGKSTDIPQSLYLLDEIRNRMKFLLENSLYDNEEKKDFWISMWGSCVYNKFCLFSGSYIEMEDEVNEVLNFQRRNNRIHLIPELLLCKSIILLSKSMF